MRERKRDYVLMADVFRQIYLKHREKPYQFPAQLFLDLLNEFTVMLQRDNPHFSRARFISYIREGR